ncbi:VOC family protein [Streptomyces sp. NPDC056682]|uniref:VOC family protein n=1 Tax=Streptomyces sp. NPDC056682 TaxID=3345909 RepID=UPI0036BFFF7B
MEITTPGMRLASVVLNVFDLEQSTGFYQDVLGLRVRLTTSTAALLVGLDGSQLYLRSLSPRADHTTSGIGLHAAIWTAPSAKELLRCEQVLKARGAHVATETVEGFVRVEGSDPNGVPVVVTHPGPDEAEISEIISRVYSW